MRLLAALIIASGLAASAASAQSSAGPQPAAAVPMPLQEQERLEGRRNQKIERLVHEDKGSRIEELRYGGQTVRIIVQPKADVPPYEVDPAPLSRSRPADNRNGMGSAGGQPYWNLLQF